MQRIWLLLLGVVGFPYLIMAQNAGRITGRVVDKTNNHPLEGATISILNKASGIFITHAVSKKDGNFSIGNLQTQTEIELIISYEGFKDTSAVLTTTKKLMATGDWKLIHSSDELESVTVTSRKPPFRVKKDTLEFDATAFKSLPTDMVQDLLRKLPGLVMDEEGNITVNGKKVNKIKVDGRDFFGSNLKAASENLPGAIIEKVQVYETKERGEQKTSIIDPNNKDVTLNLTLKKDNKKGIFGHLNTGYGTLDRYKATGFLNSFDEGKRLSVFAGTGNINNMQGMQGGGQMMVVGLEESGGIAKNNTNGGINFNNDFGKKGKLDLSYEADMNNGVNTTITNRTNILPDSSFLYNSDAGAKTITRNHRLDAGFVVELDTLQTISFTPKVSFTENITDAFNNASSTTTKGENINSQQNKNRNNDNSFTLGNRFNYTRISADKKTNISLNWDINYRQGNGTQSNFSENTFYKNGLIDIDTVNQSGNTNNNGVSNNLSLNIYRHLSKKIIGIVNYTFIQNSDNYNKDVFNFNNTSNKHDLLDSTYSIHNKNTGITHLPTASIGYKGNKFSAEVGAGVRVIRQDNHIIWKDSTIQVNQQNFSPRANFSYRLSKNSQITAGYTVNANQPTPEQLAPVQDNTNPLYIKLGNPSLKSEIIHQFNTDLTYYTSDYKWHASLKGSGTVNRNAMVENNYYDTSGRTFSSFQNVNGNNQFDVNITLGHMIRSSEWNFMFGVTSGIRSGNSIGFVAEEQNNSKTTQFNSELHAGVNYKSSFFTMVNAGINMNKTNYSLNGIEDINYNLKNLMVFSKWSPVKRFAIKTSVMYYYNSQLPADFQRSRTLINSSLSYNFLKNERLTVDVGVNDILNNNTAVTRTVKPNAIEVKQVNALRRYGMLTVNYRLSQFNASPFF
jgi:hypothetical protein